MEKRRARGDRPLTESAQRGRRPADWSAADGSRRAPRVRDVIGGDSHDSRSRELRDRALLRGLHLATSRLSCSFHSSGRMRSSSLTSKR